MKHDPIRMTCSNCIWWKRQGAQLAIAERDPSCPKDVGVCHARCPSVGQFTRDFSVSLFPRTHETRFCGDWQGISYDGDGGERIVVPFPPQAARAAA